MSVQHLNISKESYEYYKDKQSEVIKADIEYLVFFCKLVDEAEPEYLIARAQGSWINEWREQRVLFYSLDGEAFFCVKGI